MITSKRNALLTAGAVLVLLVVMPSCGDSGGGGGSDAQTVVRQAYAKGYGDAIDKVRSAARQAKSVAREKVMPTLILGSIIAALLTLHGATVTEYARRRLGDMLHLTVEKHLILAEALYAACVLVVALTGLWRYGVKPSIPVAALLAGTIPAFKDLLAAIRTDDPPSRRMAIGKIKSLLFLCAVVFMVYEILSDGGLLGIGFGG